jgi:hypothetical protein
MSKWIYYQSSTYVGDLWLGDNTWTMILGTSHQIEVKNYLGNNIWLTNNLVNISNFQWN